MPERSAFQYTVLRVVPRVERGEFLNVGGVLFCPQRQYLGARIELDAEKLYALSPDCDPVAVRASLGAIAAVVAGAPGSGALGAMTESERFGWAAAKSSTAIQPSEVHTGLTEDPAATVDRLFGALVA